MSPIRALVIGAEGFAGGHLMAHLRDQGDEAIGTMRPLPGAAPGELLPLEIRDRDAAAKLLQEVAPDLIFHLAALTFVPESMRDPLGTFAVNTMGALHVYEAAQRLPRSPRFVFISTSEAYGHVQPHEVPVGETRRLDPRTPYAASKVATELALRSLANLPGRPEWVVLRSFNHTGPGQAPSFVCASFASQIAAIEAGRQEPVIHVGNLKAERDFTDVRDVVRAYRLAALRGSAGCVYNVASGQCRSIASVLEALLGMVSVEIRVEVDPDLLRPVDMPVMTGDASALRAATGWRPQIPFERTLQDLLDHWRTAGR